MLGNNINYLFLLVLSLCAFESTLKAQDNVSFDKYQWQKDTLGKDGYRLRANSKEMQLLLLGKNKKQVIHILGVPDFIDKQKRGYSYNYCIEGGLKSNSSSNNKENNCKGSFFSVYFKNKLVEDIVVVWSGG